MATSPPDAENNESNYLKVINDPVHGFIELPPLCMKIIDTPQFQRLRDIKQLSFCSFVYPGATHSRFEHSLGTCFLAGQLVKHFQKQKHPPLGITDRDVLCVEIAALCHDLGHGPISHLWEEFMSRVKPDVAWKHEVSSVNMLNYLIEENDLKKSFRLYFGDQYEKYLHFIKLQISGKAKQRTDEPWKLSEEEDRNFLYEIVSNEDTGLDVDKWDYIARDCHHIGFKHNFCHDRIIKFSRIIVADGKKQICLPEKELLNLYNMFNSRFILYSRVYQHNVALAVGCMFLDACMQANDYIKYGSKNLCDATSDVQLFSKMTDSIFQEILYSEKPELGSARAILESIYKRELYKCVGEFKLRNGTSIKEVKDVYYNMQEYAERIVCVKKSVGFGKTGKNPLLDTYFYKKSNTDRAFKHNEMSLLLPVSANCNEEFAVFFCRDSNDLNELRKAVENTWNLKCKDF